MRYWGFCEILTALWGFESVNSKGSLSFCCWRSGARFRTVTCAHSSFPLERVCLSADQLPDIRLVGPPIREELGRRDSLRHGGTLSDAPTDRQVHGSNKKRLLTWVARMSGGTIHRVSLCAEEFLEGSTVVAGEGGNHQSPGIRLFPSQLIIQACSCYLDMRHVITDRRDGHAFPYQSCSCYGLWVERRIL